VIWAVGYIFKFQPSEVWNMTMDDLLFWNDGAGQIARWKSGK